MYLDRRYLEGSIIFLLPHGVDSALPPLTTRTSLFLMAEQVPLNELPLDLETAIVSGADVVGKRQLPTLFIAARVWF